VKKEKKARERESNEEGNKEINSPKKKTLKNKRTA
jgi:hypothetical protein